MVSPKVHLIKRQGTFLTVSACGVTQPTRVTRRVDDVTCGGCARTLLMADREAAARQRKNKRNK